MTTDPSSHAHWRAPLTRPQEAQLDELCEDHGTLRIDSFWAQGYAGSDRYAQLVGADGWIGFLDAEGSLT